MDRREEEGEEEGGEGREGGRGVEERKRKRESFLGMHHRLLKSSVEVQLYDNEGAHIFKNQILYVPEDITFIYNSAC